MQQDKSLESDHEFDKLRLAKKINSLSPNSLSAAVDSAFNILKHKQSLNKNANNRSNSDASSSSSIESMGSNYSKLANKRTNNNNSDDESKQDTSYNNYIYNYEDSQQEDTPHKFVDKYGRFFTNPNPIPMLNCIKYFESPINHSQIQYDCSAPIARNTPENNEVKLIDYRQIKIASFTVDGKELICLPQAFEMFLKNLVGGLHTVYTKLKRLDIVPIVCNVEQVRVLRGLGAIQPGVNRCKLIAPNEFDILYDDCTNSGSRPGRPPKRHPPNDSTDSNCNNTNNNNQHHHHSTLDDSSPPPPLPPPPPQTLSQHKLSTPKLESNKPMSNLNVRLDNQIHSSIMSPYCSATTPKMKFLNEENEKRSISNLASPSCFYKNDIINDSKLKNEQYAAALNYMQKLGLFQYNMKSNEMHPTFSNSFYEQSMNPAVASLALRCFPPHLSGFHNQQQLDHMPNYLNEYTTRLNELQNSLYNQQLINQADLKSCNPVREERNLISDDEQKQASENKISKTYSESLMINSRTSGTKRQEELESLKSNSNNNNSSKLFEANSDFEELEEDEDEEEEKLNRKSQEEYKLADTAQFKMHKMDSKSTLHPLSVEYLIGGGSNGVSSATSSRNDSIDVITNACSSSSSSSSSTTSSLSNNNYGQNLFSSTRSSPALTNDNYDKFKFNSWPLDVAKMHPDLYQNNSLLYICSLINIVKNSVCKLDANFKTDLESLRKSLQAEKLLRLKCDSKIQHLIRLQNILRNKLKPKTLINQVETRRRRSSILRRQLRRNSKKFTATLTAQTLDDASIDIESESLN